MAKTADSPGGSATACGRFVAECVGPSPSPRRGVRSASVACTPGVDSAGMRRRASGLLVVAGIAAVPPLSIAAAAHRAQSPQITVNPTTGSPRARFVVSFRTPDRTGRIGVFDRRDELSAHGPTGQTGCVPEVSRALPSAAAHARVTTTLDPRRLGSKWCVGAYHGEIDEIEGPACVEGQPCPEFVSRLRTLGRFAFKVASTSKDTTPPGFAGLQSAFACTPGPQRPGQTTPFTLTWTAAADNITPTAQIIYDVFMATTAGGEDFSHPNWTTAPGVTQFKTPGIASHGSFYFVVRARDQAGNEDQNRVERRGADPCL
jgi:hypothetical protein